MENKLNRCLSPFVTEALLALLLLQTETFSEDN